MEERLKALIASVVSDLIEVRSEADRQAAELAEKYRDDPTLSAFAVPKLNISNVSVDLRFGFAPPQHGERAGPDPGEAERARAIDEGSAVLRRELMGLASVREARLSPQRRGAISRRLTATLRSSAADLGDAPPDRRRAALETKMADFFRSQEVALNAADRRRLSDSVLKFDAAFTAAPAPPPPIAPRLVLPASELKEMDPNLISSIKFDINLDDVRWTEVEDEQGRVTRTLMED